MSIFLGREQSRWTGSRWLDIQYLISKLDFYEKTCFNMCFISTSCVVHVELIIYNSVLKRSQGKSKITFSVMTKIAKLFCIFLYFCAAKKVLHSATTDGYWRPVSDHWTSLFKSNYYLINHKPLDWWVVKSSNENTLYVETSISCTVSPGMFSSFHEMWNFVSKTFH